MIIENNDFDNEIIIKDFSKFNYYKNLNYSNSIFNNEILK